MVITSRNKRPKFKAYSSTQLRFALTFVVITGLVLLFLNVYCCKLSQRLFYESKQRAMSERAQLIAGEIGKLDVVTPAGIADVMRSINQLSDTQLLVTDKDGRMLVQERVKSWKGISFPGGHVEQFESITDSARREVKEETGLDIKNPKLCGTVHWCHKDTDERYIVLLYKTTEWDGELLDKTDEGEVFWINKEDFGNYHLSLLMDVVLALSYQDLASYMQTECKYVDEMIIL